MNSIHQIRVQTFRRSDHTTTTAAIIAVALLKQCIRSEVRQREVYYGTATAIIAVALLNKMHQK